VSPSGAVAAPPLSARDRRHARNGPAGSGINGDSIYFSRDPTPGRRPGGRKNIYCPHFPRLASNGDLVGCHATVERGFGPLGHDYSGPCGFFLNATWLEPRPADAAAQGGTLEVAVYIEP